MRSNVSRSIVILLTAFLAACGSAPPPDAPKSPEGVAAPDVSAAPDGAAAPDGSAPDRSAAPAAGGVAEECVWPAGTPAEPPPACPPGCFWSEKDKACKPDRGVIVPQRPPR
ncbi:hypothetical protein WMF27_33215 [Sorangium sp. So ce281]|uniref:hypothetical protein n=1 Tax=unclassified Sorangium TaxID=2621164 RepID=UPI003F62329C